MDVAPPATRTTEQAGGTYGEGTQSTTAQMRETGEELRQQASSWAEDAKSRGRQMLQERKGNAAEQLSSIARALRQSADRCRQEEGQETAGRVLGQAASGLEQVSDMLRNRDIDSMMQQASSLMRRQPGMFIGGAVAAGFLLSRFFKSSGERPEGYQERYDEADEADVSGPHYVTSAHVDPGEVSAGDRSVDSSMPGGRDY